MVEGAGLEINSCTVLERQGLVGTGSEKPFFPPHWNIRTDYQQNAEFSQPLQEMGILG